MKPRSAVAALLAVTETLLATRAKSARMKQASVDEMAHSAKLVKIAESRSLILPVKEQAIS